PPPGGFACVSVGVLNWGTVYGLSGDGSTIVGGTYTKASCRQDGFRATKWSAAGGGEGLPKEPATAATTASRANSAHYDGSIVGGWDDHSTGFRRGAMWQGGVETFLGPQGLIPYAVGEALDVTRDGTKILGSAGGPDFGAYIYHTGNGQLDILGAEPFR